MRQGHRQLPPKGRHPLPADRLCPARCQEGNRVPTGCPRPGSGEECGLWSVAFHPSSATWASRPHGEEDLGDHEGGVRAIRGRTAWGGGGVAGEPSGPWGWMGAGADLERLCGEVRVSDLVLRAGGAPVSFHAGDRPVRSCLIRTDSAL